MTPVTAVLTVLRTEAWRPSLATTTSFQVCRGKLQAHVLNMFDMFLAGLFGPFKEVNRRIDVGLRGLGRFMCPFKGINRGAVKLF